MTSPKAGDLSARLRAMFVEELEDQVGAANAHLLALERNPTNAEELRSLFRVMHTLKGAARSANVPDLEKLCHKLEALLASARDAGRALTTRELETLFAGVDRLTAAGTELRSALPSDANAEMPEESAVDRSAGPTRDGVPTPGGVRIGQDRIDVLFGASNRLLILSSQVGAQPEAIEELHETAAHASSAWRRIRRALDAAPIEQRAQLERDSSALDDSVNALGRQTSALLGTSMRAGRDLQIVAGDVARGVRDLRLRPFADAVADLPRVARDIAAETGKEVRVEIHGENVQADRVVLAQVHDALLHLVRNAVDHGIEAPSVRRTQGKAPEGTIRIRAGLVGDRLIVSVEDDGAGLDIAAMRKLLLDRHEQVPADDRAVARLLFLGGISTRESATSISGRGVGLDAVRAVAERIRGGVDVSWTAGRGTTFTIDAPLTLATVRVIVARASGTHIAIPAAFITKLLLINRESLRVVDGQPVVETDGAPARIVSLASILGPPLVDRVPDGAVRLVLVRAAGDRQVALRVDELLEEAEVVVRPVRAHGRVAVPHVTGGAMLAGGTVALVLNMTAVIGTALGLPGESKALSTARPDAAPRKRVLVVDDSITTRTLEASVLEAAGYEVVTAVDGADGWRVLQERGADLVVSDVEMPRMDGLQLTESIRASSRFHETPVILVTALESAEHRSRGLEVGADAYLGKSSFEQEGLLNTVRELLG